MNESQPLPSETDINVHGSLDGRIAAEHFLGKSLAEVEALFRENSLYYQEDLLWMGPVAFRFYIQAAINYVQSEHANGDSDIVSCLAMILRERLRNEPAELVPIAGLLIDFCAYVVVHFERFDTSPDIDGDLRGDYVALGTSFQQLAMTKSQRLTRLS